MIRSCFLRNTAVKIAFKKEIRNVKNFRCITSMGRPPRKKVSFRQTSFILMDSDRKDLSPNFRFYCSYPNHHKVLLPALSPTMEHGTIISWEKKEGDKLNEGDLLAEIETDKATMGFETPEEGYLAKILVPAGSKNVPIGKLVCIIVQNESDVAAFKNFTDAGSVQPLKELKSQAAAPPPPPPPPPPSPSPSPSLSAQPLSAPKPPRITADAIQTGKIFASPLAKKLAKENGLLLENVAVRSGLFGSIKSTDLESAKGAASAAVRSSYKDNNITTMRNIIAKRVLESKQKVPHYYLTVDINITSLMTIKKKINALTVKEGINLSLNDFVIKAVSLASKKVPEANSMWMDTFIRQYENVHVSVAVSTAKGILTPIVFNADQKGLATISSEIKQLAVKAREGNLEPREYEGGTITVSNLGMFGVNSFSAIINPPQSCIIAVGSSEKRLLPDLNSEKGFKLCEILWVTLSCDHRVLDGAVGAKWLSVFREYMENPDLLML